MVSACNLHNAGVSDAGLPGNRDGVCVGRRPVQPGGPVQGAARGGRPVVLPAAHCQRGLLPPNGGVSLVYPNDPTARMQGFQLIERHSVPTAYSVLVRGRRVWRTGTSSWRMRCWTPTRGRC